MLVLKILAFYAYPATIALCPLSCMQITLALVPDSAAYLTSLLTDGRLLGSFLKASWTLCDSTLTLKAVQPSAVLLPLVELSSANSFLLSGNSPQAACLRPTVQ